MWIVDHLTPLPEYEGIQVTNNRRLGQHPCFLLNMPIQAFAYLNIRVVYILM